MKNIHTDMAVEAHEYYSSSGNIPGGINITKRNFGGLKYTEIDVTDEEGADFIGKPPGTYITLEAEDLRGSVIESYKQSRNFISKEIENLLKKNNIKEADPILVIGLGNWDITPDALGPKTVSSLFVSRHLFEHLPQLVNKNIRPVSAISPGVLGTTGIETLEIAKGIVERTKPACVIAIDALVARDVKRLGTSLQLSDSGINPGSGVGNHRKGLNQETLGVPVISIGVPTVVDAATIVENITEKILPENQKKLIEKSIKNFSGELIVTPKDIDEMVSDISEVIASALNIGLHCEDISELMQ